MNSIELRTTDRDTQRESERECQCPRSSGSSGYKKDRARERSAPNVGTLVGYKCLINEMKNDTCYRSGHISLSMAFVLILHVFFLLLFSCCSLSNLFMPQSNNTIFDNLKSIGFCCLFFCIVVFLCGLFSESRTRTSERGRKRKKSQFEMTFSKAFGLRIDSHQNERKKWFFFVPIFGFQFRKQLSSQRTNECGV